MCGRHAKCQAGAKRALGVASVALPMNQRLEAFETRFLGCNSMHGRVLGFLWIDPALRLRVGCSWRGLLASLFVRGSGGRQ